MYQLPQDRKVSLLIYNVLGQLVRTLVQDVQSAGAYTVHWNGTNDHANAVGTGVYFYRLEARAITSGQGEEFVETRKMIFLK